MPRIIERLSLWTLAASDGRVGLEAGLVNTRVDGAPKRSLVLHVGPHKTGSTYLQHRLLNNRAILASHGWDYPEFGLTQFAQHRIYQWLMGNAAAAGDVTEAGVVDMLSRSDRIILSSEDFVYLPADRLRRLHALMPDMDVQIVYFVRSSVYLWPSHWQELVRWGRDDTLLEYLGSFAGWTKTFEASSMNPIVHLTKFADIFGKHALRLICYDNIAQDDGDIFDFFWTHVLGLSDVTPPGSARIIHPSQPLHMIEMLRSLNQLYRERKKASPGDRILATYQKKQKIIEATPAYDEFKAGFIKHAGEVRLSSRQEAVRSQEDRLMSLYGDRIMNKVSPDRLFVKEVFERTLPYAHRYWTDRFGFSAYVSSVLDGLALG
jgi:hypothetical protein